MNLLMMMMMNKEAKRKAIANGIYEYKARKYGRIIKKPTEGDSSFISVRQNDLIEGLPGTDDFSYAQHDGKRYKYIINDSDIKDFGKYNKTQNSKRQEKRDAKGRRQVGNIFTIADDKIADEVFRLVAGNSNVEYGKLGYRYEGSPEKQNQIWNSGSPTSTSTGPLGRPEQKSKRKIIMTDFTHSHPFKYAETASTKYPSDKDRLFYADTKDKTSDFRLYSPWTPDKEKLPHTMRFTDMGLEGFEYKIPDDDRKKNDENYYLTNYIKERGNKLK